MSIVGRAPDVMARMARVKRATRDRDVIGVCEDLEVAMAELSHLILASRKPAPVTGVTVASVTPTVTRNANADRQKRYRERQKAARGSAA